MCVMDLQEWYTPAFLIFLVPKKDDFIYNDSDQDLLLFKIRNWRGAAVV